MVISRRFSILLAALWLLVVLRVAVPVSATAQQQRTWTVSNLSVGPTIVSYNTVGLTTSGWPSVETDTEFINTPAERSARCRNFCTMVG
jgi:beta-lactamase regulating signal transducer with metallopeptidase domain